MLIERTAQAHRRGWLKAGALLALSAALLSSAPSLRAQTAASKIAADLQQVIGALTTPTDNWAKDVNGVRMVKVRIISNHTDPDLVALRADVMTRGGVGGPRSVVQDLRTGERQQLGSEDELRRLLAARAEPKRLR